VPAGKKHPIKVTIATIKRDLTALSSVCGYCVDEEWIESNPVMARLKPGGRRKSRLQERRDPIMLPNPAQNPRRHPQGRVRHLPPLINFFEARLSIT
jgi:hypothetical protein